jgi:anti-anti-sigma factor
MEPQMGKSAQFANSRHLIRRSSPKKNSLRQIRTQEVIENTAQLKKKEPENNPSETQADPKKTQENPGETQANPRNSPSPGPSRPKPAPPRPIQSQQIADEKYVLKFPPHGADNLSERVDEADRMHVNIDQNAGVLKLSGHLDIDSADSLRDALIAAASDRPLSRLDLGEVESCDLAALQVLLAFRKHSESSAAPLPWEPLAPAVAELAASVGLSLGEPLAV